GGGVWTATRRSARSARRSGCRTGKRAPSTSLFRSLVRGLLDQQLVAARARRRLEYAVRLVGEILFAAEQADQPDGVFQPPPRPRSEEHTSELQSQSKLVCRLLLEKKKQLLLKPRAA